MCSEGFIFPTSGSQTITISLVDAIGDGNKKFAPDSYICKQIRNNGLEGSVSGFIILLLIIEGKKKNCINRFSGCLVKVNC